MGRARNRDKFQSLIGFKINWNFNPKNQNLLYLPFQSLIGFKINWNLIGAKLLPDQMRSFNP